MLVFIVNETAFAVSPALLLNKYGSFTLFSPIFIFLNFLALCCAVVECV